MVFLLWIAMPCRSPSLRVSQGASRGVAQSGSAPALGAGGRWFESTRPDQEIVRCGDDGTHIQTS